MLKANGSDFPSGRLGCEYGACMPAGIGVIKEVE